jgi:hypothetical protein
MIVASVGTFKDRGLLLANQKAGTLLLVAVLDGFKAHTRSENAFVFRMKQRTIVVMEVVEK